MPSFEYLHAERKKAGVTLELLPLEYLEKPPPERVGWKRTRLTECEARSTQPLP
jgi:hypothetical protein